MSASWPKVRLGDHVDLLSGFAFKSKQFTDDQDDIPLVKGANVHQGYIDWEKAVRWPKDEFSQYEKYHLKANDVVLAMDRPWIEAGLKFSWIKPNDPDSMLVQRVSRLRGINGLSSRYLRYVIGSPQFTNYIKPIVTGVNVPHISGGQIKDYKFNLPPELLQDQIADIIEPYDNLIENNNRRIAILEEMAQSLYREWFVKFRFPDHENVKFKDSPLGQIPEEWEVKKLKEFGEVITGKTPSKKKAEYYESRDVHFIKTPDMHKDVYVIDTGEMLSFAGADSQKKKLLPANSISVSCIGTAGVVAINAEPAQTNQQINSIVLAEDSELEFLYFALLDLKQTIINHGSTGATMTNLSKGKFEDLDVIYPKNNYVSQFNSDVKSMFDEILVLLKKNKNLKKQRDMLLPKLISGKINLKD